MKFKIKIILTTLFLLSPSRLALANGAEGEYCNHMMGFNFGMNNFIILWPSSISRLVSFSSFLFDTAHESSISYKLPAHTATTGKDPTRQAAKPPTMAKW